MRLLSALLLCLLFSACGQKKEQPMTEETTTSVVDNNTIKLYDQPGGAGKEVPVPYDQYFIHDIHGDWLEVYVDQGQQRISGWVPIGQMTSPRIMMKPQDIKLPTASKLSATTIKTSNDEDTPSQVTFNYTGLPTVKNPIWSAPVYSDSGFAPVEYGLFYTGDKALPFLLFFSGQSGDAFSIPGELVSFHPERDFRPTLPLNDGNRVVSEFVGLSGDTLFIQEAWHCQIGVQNAYQIVNGRPLLTTGTFPAGSVYPPGDVGLSEEEYAEAKKLNRDLIVFPSPVQDIATAEILLAGMSITIELLSIDHEAELVHVRINNEKEGYVKAENLKRLELISGMYSGGCGVG